MVKATVVNNIVTNIIEIEEAQCDEYADVAGVTLFDVEPWGLTMGDTYDGESFWRDGVKLPARQQRTPEHDEIAPRN